MTDLDGIQRLLAATRPTPACTPADIAARVAYTELSRWRQLATQPPPGWSGAWAARVVSRCAARVRRRAGKETGE